MGTITRTTANNLTTNQGEGVMVNNKQQQYHLAQVWYNITSQIDSTYTHYCWKFISLRVIQMIKI